MKTFKVGQFIRCNCGDIPERPMGCGVRGQIDHVNVNDHQYELVGGGRIYIPHAELYHKQVDYIAREPKNSPDIKDRLW